jgi:hypothetical protein
MNCRVCGARAEGEFCEMHAESCENLQRNYEAWKKSMGLSWADYLREIQKNIYAGIWVKEVAQCLLSSNPPKEGNSPVEASNI